MSLCLDYCALWSSCAPLCFPPSWCSCGLSDVSALAVHTLSIALTGTILTYRSQHRAWWTTGLFSHRYPQTYVQTHIHALKSHAYMLLSLCTPVPNCSKDWFNMRHSKTSKSECEDARLCSSRNKSQKKKIALHARHPATASIKTNFLLVFHNVRYELSNTDYLNLIYKFRCTWIYLHCTQILQSLLLYFS